MDINRVMEVNFKMKNDIIIFKGVNDGLYLEINSKDFKSALKDLEEKLKESLGFFKGAKFLGVEAENLSDKEKLEINLILKYKYGFNITLDKILTMISQSEILQDNQDTIELEASKIPKDLYTIESKFVHKTLRSGQAVEHDGNIVVVGDVNPGAFLKSTGSIIVLGTLRGVAHAGASGDREAIVAAYNLSPSQLRIGNLIVRAPDEEIPEYKLPEIARIDQNKVIIEPYLPKKQRGGI